MYLSKKNFMCIAIINIYLLVIVLSYETRCPDFMERSILSQKCSSEEPFHCLKDDNSKTFIQGCRKWEWVANGSFPVLSGRYIYYKECMPNTYQPYIYKSNEGYNCSFAKSLCKELGHVTLNNGTTVTNRFCGCDHTRGYVFVNGLTTGSCNPVLEDCSCYSRGCGLGQNPNYDFVCGREDKVEISMTERNNIYRPLVNTHEYTISATLKHEYRKYILTTLVVISVILRLAIFSVLIKKDTNQETIIAKQLTNNPVKYKQDWRLPILQSTNKDIPRATYTEQSKFTEKVQMRSEDSVEDQYNSTIARPQSTQTIKTQPVIEHKTSKTYTVPSNLTDNLQIKSLSSVEDSADILIVDLEYPQDMAKVIEFKHHLRSLVPELCYRDIQIKLFEEINMHTSSTKQIMLPELFNRCKYLFVYISKFHLPAKAFQKGLCEKDLVSAMTTSDYRNIITVCDCEDWNYPDKYRTNLNYFNYKQSKDCEAYKSCLRGLFQTLR